MRRGTMPAEPLIQALWGPLFADRFQEARALADRIGQPVGVYETPRGTNKSGVPKGPRRFRVAVIADMPTDGRAILRTRVDPVTPAIRGPIERTRRRETHKRARPWEGIRRRE